MAWNRGIELRLGGKLAPLAALLLATSACVSVDRPGAQALGKAGVDGLGAIAQELDTRAANINRAIALHNFGNAYLALEACASAQEAVTAVGVPTSRCDILTIANGLRTARVPAIYRNIHDVIGARARATRAISAAYASLILEAEYDARGSLQPALVEATDALNGFASILQMGPVADVITTGIVEIGGLIADSAQRRRLEDGSRRLQQLTEHFRVLLEKERDLYNRTQRTVQETETTARNYLMPLLPAGPLLNQVLGEARLPPVTEGQAQALVVASAPLRNALQASSLARSPGDSDRAFAAATTLLVALEEQHSKFQAGLPISLSDMATAVDRLTAIVDAINEDQDEGDAQ